MLKIWQGLIGLGFFFAAFSASNNYQLNSYGVGPGATNSSTSTTYTAQGVVGQQTNNSATGTTYTGNNGPIQAEQINVPPAPTLSNGSGTYYNKLNFIINNSIDPSDATYAVAVSTDNFATTNYVQANGTLSGSAVYQTYTTWGGGSGSFITGLAPSTSYEVKVAAKQGLFTNTKFGAFAAASTVSSSMTFSVSPNTLTLSNLLAGSIITSSNIAFTFVTNASNGGNIYVIGQNTGLFSSSQNHTIAAYSGNLSSPTEGFGLQATSPGQTSGGPLATVSPFNGSGNTVGAESTVPQPVLTTSAAIVGGTANANVQAKAAGSTPTGTDYQEVLTFVAAAGF